MSIESGRAFIIRPFGTKKNSSGEEINFDEVEEKLVTPALEAAGLSGGTTGEIITPGGIHEDMFREIVVADVVIADITMHNANAFYELGIRHALRDRFTVLIRADKHKENHVFDLKPERYLTYSLDNPGESVPLLVEAITKAVQNDEIDSPVYRWLPNLNCVDPNNVIVVPDYFTEQVTLAADEKNLDGLLKLRDEALDQHWEKEGLRIVGRALFDKANNDKFHQAGAEVWELVRAYSQLDKEANRALATHYQKLSQFKESELAAERCLGLYGTRGWELAELHALMGSNYKTRWSHSFNDANTIEECQKAALTSDLLTKAYDAYHSGFECHRSHYYSGLNAVSMLKMQIHLAEKHLEEWVYLFEKEEDANHQLVQHIAHIKKLEAATDLAITTAIKHYKEDAWAPISRADLLLLTSTDPKRVAVAYARCERNIEGFKASSVLEQLQLYQSLGLFENNVNAVMELIKE